ncbi:MAG: thioredoxin family protein [Gemmatimonadaceae bacterium]
MSLTSRYASAPTFDQFLRDVEANAELWRALAKRAHVPLDVVARVEALGGRWHFLVLVEDWCGDAINSLPVVAKLAALAHNLELRVVARDKNLDLMVGHLSPTGAAAIPVVILLDDSYVERGWWGSRPAELQRWVHTVGLTMSKEDRYRKVRRWYVQDRGAATLREFVDLLEGAARPTLAA